MFSALDFADELDVDLYQLVDTVLDEIEEAKQKNITKDSDDQIMPSASPTLYVSLIFILFCLFILFFFLSVLFSFLFLYLGFL